MCEMSVGRRVGPGPGLIVGMLLLACAAPVAAQESGGAAPAAQAPAPAPAPTAEPAPGSFRQGGEAQGAQVSGAVLQQAKRHFDAGVSAFQQGLLGSARAEFEEAYRLSKEPDLLFNLAQVAAELDKAADAASYYERFLAARPATPDRADVEEKLKRLRARVALESKEQAVKEEARRPAPPPLPPPAPPRGRPTAAMAVLGVGGGALVGGIALLAASAGIARSVNGGERFDPALVDRGLEVQRAGIALSVIGGATAAVGGAWLLYHYKRSDGRERPRVAIVPLGAGLAISGSF